MRTFFQWVESIDEEIGQPKIVITPNPEHGELLVKSNVPEGLDSVYKTVISFKNVKFKPAPPGQQTSLNSQIITNPKNGVKYHLTQIVPDKKYMNSHCTCPGFRQRDWCEHANRVMQELMAKGIVAW